MCVRVGEQCESLPCLDFLKPPFPFKAASGLHLLRPPPYSIAKTEISLSTQRSTHQRMNEDERAKTKTARKCEKIQEKNRAKTLRERERDLGLEENKERKGGVSRESNEEAELKIRFKCGSYNFCKT